VLLLVCLTHLRAKLIQIITVFNSQLQLLGERILLATMFTCEYICNASGQRMHSVPTNFLVDDFELKIQLFVLGMRKTTCYILS
jgi:hypothetical protein